MEETAKQIIISKVKLVKDGIRINYEKYRDSYWDTLQLTSDGGLLVKFGFKLFLPISGESVSVVTPALKEPPPTMKNHAGAPHPKFMATQTWEAVQHLLDETEKYINGRRAQGNLFESDAE